MARNETNLSKVKMSYELTKRNKFFRKARAMVIKDKKLLLIRVDYKSGHVHYLLPGGGVDAGEEIKHAIIRETLEEYNADVTPIKYLDKQYYNVELEYNGEKFISHRVEYYYVCRFDKFSNRTKMGVGKEFENPEKKYSKVELSYDEVKRLKPKQINDMCERTYQKLLNYLKSVQ